MFDKGCTFLIIFGMPGKKHEDEPTRALKAADNIMKDFHANKLQASIGIYYIIFNKLKHIMYPIMDGAWHPSPSLR